MGLVVAGLALAFGMAWVVGHRFIARPIGLLLAAADRWRAGDYSARTGLAGSRAELGALGAAFDGMAEEIGRRQGEQERTTAALRESEERLRATQEHAGVGIGEVDARGADSCGSTRRCAPSPATARDELLRPHVFDFTHPDDSRPRSGTYRPPGRGRGRAPTRARSATGAGRAASAGSRSRLGRARRGGRFLYGVRIVQDITDRKLAEARQGSCSRS